VCVDEMMFACLLDWRIGVEMTRRSVWYDSDGMTAVEVAERWKAGVGV
jgi:hypothetical protein